MMKVEFLFALREKLSFLSREEAEERLAFYSEMIDDRMDEGLSEQQAVAEIGSVNEIAAQIVSEIPLTKLAKKKIKPKRRLAAWEVVLLILGSPIWLSVLISLFAVGLSLYASLWAVIISLWAVAIAVIVSAIGCFVLGAFCCLHVNGLTGLAAIGAGCVCAGLAIFFCLGCKAATKGLLWLAKKAARGIKMMLLKKENGE